MTTSEQRSYLGSSNPLRPATIRRELDFFNGDTQEAMRIIHEHVNMSTHNDSSWNPFDMGCGTLPVLSHPLQRTHSASENLPPHGLERAPAVTVGDAGGDYNGGMVSCRPMKLSDRLSPLIQQRIREVFDEVEDRSVLEDRSLMLLLSKIPEPQTLEALHMYERAVQQRGRSTINNPCGYMISLLKKAQVGTLMEKRDDNKLMSLDECSIKQSARPFRTLKPRVRAELEKTFDSKRDRSVLEDVGLMKQLGRLDEDQAVEAISNYREVAGRRGGKSILNPSAYMMVILREYIEGTTPLPAAHSSLPPPCSTRRPSSSGSGSTSQFQFHTSSPQQHHHHASHYGPGGLRQTRSEEELLSGPNSAPAQTAFDYGFPGFSGGQGGQQSHSPLILPVGHHQRAPGSADDTWGWTGSGVLSPPNGQDTGASGSGAIAGAGSPLPLLLPPAAGEETGELAGRLAETARTVVEQGDMGRHRQQQLDQWSHQRRQEEHQQQRERHMHAQQHHQNQSQQQRSISPQGSDQQRRRHSTEDRPSSSLSDEAKSSGGHRTTRVHTETSEDSEVVAFLSRLGLHKYAPALREAEVDMAALSLFEENDLRELGLPKGPRIKILHTLNERQQQLS